MNIAHLRLSTMYSISLKKMVKFLVRFTYSTLAIIGWMFDCNSIKYIDVMILLEYYKYSERDIEFIIV